MFMNHIHFLEKFSLIYSNHKLSWLPCRFKVTKKTRERPLRYTKGYKNIVAKTSLPPPIYPGPSTTLDDGSTLKVVDLPSTSSKFFSFSSLNLLPPLSKNNNGNSNNANNNNSNNNNNTHSNTSLSSSSSPPMLYYLSPNQIEEMRSLRNTDPKTWTITALMKKFHTTRFLVSRFAPLSFEWKEKFFQEQEDAHALLSEKYRKRRLMRAQRRALLEESYHQFNF